VPFLEAIGTESLRGSVLATSLGSLVRTLSLAFADLALVVPAVVKRKDHLGAGVVRQGCRFSARLGVIMLIEACQEIGFS
jgi:hypothetical protein